MRDLVFHQTPLSDLKVLISEAVAEQLKSLPLYPPKEESKILTRQETAKLLSVSLPTLHEWTKTGVIQGTRIGSCVRYRMADIEAALQEIQNVKHKR